jgi:hypothetical protein
MDQFCEATGIQVDWEDPPATAASALTALEVCQRLYALDKKKGEARVLDVLNGRIRYRRLVEDLKEARSKYATQWDAHRKTRRLGDDLAAAFLEAFPEDSKPLLAPQDDNIIWSRPPRSTGLFAITVDLIGEAKDRFGGSHVDGAECLVLASDAERRQWPRHRMRISYYSHFFRRLWIVVGAGQDMAITIRDELALLQLRNVGVVNIPRWGIEIDPLKAVEFEVISVPDWGPMPDLRHLRLQPAVS